MKRRLLFLDHLDSYVTRICCGSFLVCFCFIVGLFVLVELLENIERYADSIEQLPDEYRRLGVFLVIAYYLTNLPFLYLVVAPFVTVTAAMFAVSRLMGANEVVPMLFTGRPLRRVLMPLLVMGVGNAVLMVGLREYVLPELVTAKDNLKHMLDHGQLDRSIDDKVIALPAGNKLYVDRFWLQSGVLENMILRVRRPGSDTADSIRAARAEWVGDGELGPGWRLTEGLVRRADGADGDVLTFLPGDAVEGFDPTTLRTRLKEDRELLDLSFSELAELVAGQPTVAEYTVALHHNLTFPLANVLLLLLALPFALRFERGSKAERVVFALLVCGAYLVVDLIFQNLGKQAIMQPVLAAWLPSLMFGSLGIVMFDTVST